uniref:Uncharacterized protein n=1 Tax=Aegilops tauschii TaxID=37682 RepID=M8BYC2_AEGTA
MALLYEWITKFNMKGAMEALVPMNEMAEAMTTMLLWCGGDGAISADPAALEAVLSFSSFFFLVCSLVDGFWATWRVILGLWDVSHLEEIECSPSPVRHWSKSPFFVSGHLLVPVSQVSLPTPLARNMNGWERTLMNQVGSAGLGVGGSGGMRPWQPQMQDVVGHAAAADPQFVRLRDNAREKIFGFQATKSISGQDIKYYHLINDMEYHNMTRRPMQPTMMFAIKTYTAQNRQYRQNQQSLRQIASSSPGYGAMNLTSNIMQGASENSRVSYVTGNVGSLSSSAHIVLHSANMDTSLPAI